VLNRNLLHQYQLNAIEYIKRTPKCALWMDMGLGKTITTLTALNDLKYYLETKKVLIIAPLRVAHHTWPDEIKAWSHIDLSFTVIKGNPAKRLELLKDDSDIHIINREQVVWLVEHFKKKFPYDTVVIDESSSFKALSSKRFRKLRSVCRIPFRIIELTGTPAPNGLLDLWPQMYLLDQGDRLGRTMGSYKSNYFVSDYMGYSFTPRKGSSEKIYKKLDDICTTLSAKDYLDMPSKINNMIKVQMPQKARKVYSELEKDFLFFMENEEAITAANSAVLVGKLLQLTSGAIYINDEKDYEAYHNEKLEALAEIIEEAAGEPILVAYNFKHEKERILKKFKQAVPIERLKDPISSWNNKEVPVLLVHPASAGHGLNLQKGGHIAVWFGLTWSLELYQQFNARLHRQGQEKPVFIHHIICEDSADEQVVEALNSKSFNQNELLKALKRKLKK